LEPAPKRFETIFHVIPSEVEGPGGEGGGTQILPPNHQVPRFTLGMS